MRLLLAILFSVLLPLEQIASAANGYLLSAASCAPRGCQMESCQSPVSTVPVCQQASCCLAPASPAPMPQSPAVNSAPAQQELTSPPAVAVLRVVLISSDEVGAIVGVNGSPPAVPIYQLDCSLLL
jgi:hypothetical protein